MTAASTAPPPGPWSPQCRERSGRPPVYALELTDGIALIDAGWDTDEAWNALLHGLDQAGHPIGDVRAVLVTHIHPDHYGLANRMPGQAHDSGRTRSIRSGSIASPLGRFGSHVRAQQPGNRHRHHQPDQHHDSRSDEGGLV
ncbi:MBL fold metallo-hydrolase [Streptosporangium album]|nr:MBL fold metallo-hydrolase [Streptosporangium album]